jgi:hypothetical protein
MLSITLSSRFVTSAGDLFCISAKKQKAQTFSTSENFLPSGESTMGGSDAQQNKGAGRIRRRRRGRMKTRRIKGKWRRR